jgi:hypothetical protein
MIIYQALAGRLYPKVLDEILNGIDSDGPENKNKNNKEFHSPLILLNNFDLYKTPSNILRMFPSSLKNDRFEGFLYGVFSSINLNKKSEDFHFTIINHPVDQIYELFAYWNFAKTRDISKLDKTSQNLTLHERYSIVFQQNKSYSIEEYIDAILRREPIYLYYNGFKYEPMPELFYGHQNIKDFNYIGKYSEIKKTFKSLSNIFDFYIKPFEDKQVVSYKGSFYKRNLLEKMLKDQLEVYENLKC